MQKIETGFSELLHKQPETETQKDAYNKHKSAVTLI